MMMTGLTEWLHDALDREEHTSSVASFYHRFEAIRCLIQTVDPEIPEEYFASRFMFGLQAEFQSFIFKFQPTTVIAAYRLSLIFEESLYLDYFPEIELSDDDNCGSSAVEYPMTEGVMLDDLSSNVVNFTDKECGPMEEAAEANITSDSAMMCNNQDIHSPAVQHRDIVSTDMNQAITETLFNESALVSNQDTHLSSVLPIDMVSSCTSAMTVDSAATEEFVDQVEVPIAWDSRVTSIVAREWATMHIDEISQMVWSNLMEALQVEFDTSSLVEAEATDSLVKDNSDIDHLHLVIENNAYNESANGTNVRDVAAPNDNFIAVFDVSNFQWEPGPDLLVFGVHILLQSVTNSGARLYSVKMGALDSSLLFHRFDRDSAEVKDDAHACIDGAVARISASDQIENFFNQVWPYKIQYIMTHLLASNIWSPINAGPCISYWNTVLIWMVPWGTSSTAVLLVQYTVKIRNKVEQATARHIRNNLNGYKKLVGSKIYSTGLKTCIYMEICFYMELPTEFRWFQRASGECPFVDFGSVVTITVIQWFRLIQSYPLILPHSATIAEHRKVNLVIYARALLDNHQKSESELNYHQNIHVFATQDSDTLPVKEVQRRGTYSLMAWEAQAILKLSHTSYFTPSINLPINSAMDHWMSSIVVSTVQDIPSKIMMIYLHILQSKCSLRFSRNSGITDMSIWLYDLGIPMVGLPNNARLLWISNALAASTCYGSVGMKQFAATLHIMVISIVLLATHGSVVSRLWHIAWNTRLQFLACVSNFCSQSPVLTAACNICVTSETLFQLIAAAIRMTDVCNCSLKSSLSTNRVRGSHMHLISVLQGSGTCLYSVLDYYSCLSTGGATPTAQQHNASATHDIIFISFKNSNEEVAIQFINPRDVHFFWDPGPLHVAEWLNVWEPCEIVSGDIFCLSSLGSSAKHFCYEATVGPLNIPWEPGSWLLHGRSNSNWYFSDVYNGTKGMQRLKVEGCRFINKVPVYTNLKGKYMYFPLRADLYCKMAVHTSYESMSRSELFLLSYVGKNNSASRSTFLYSEGKQWYHSQTCSLYGFHSVGILDVTLEAATHFLQDVSVTKNISLTLYRRTLLAGAALLLSVGKVQICALSRVAIMCFYPGIFPSFYDAFQCQSFQMLLVCRLYHSSFSWGGGPWKIYYLIMAVVTVSLQNRTHIGISSPLSDWLLLQGSDHTIRSDYAAEESQLPNWKARMFESDGTFLTFLWRIAWVLFGHCRGLFS